VKIVDVVIPSFQTNKKTDQEPKITVMFWFKEIGDTVNKGDDLVEVQTDKAVLDIESPATGKLKKVFYHAGDQIRAGQKIGEIEQEEVG
jgi:pyruvate/2-oxoglutarate dehydrogenase complex dihydrolipoamide acyltransferase (E2) component